MNKELGASKIWVDDPRAQKSQRTIELEKDGGYLEKTTKEPEAIGITPSGAAVVYYGLSEDLKPVLEYYPAHAIRRILFNEPVPEGFFD